MHECLPLGKKFTMAQKVVTSGAGARIDWKTGRALENGWETGKCFPPQERPCIKTGYANFS